MNRRTAREITLGLIFNYSFNMDTAPDELFKLYIAYYPDEETGVIAADVKRDKYILPTYNGVIEKLSEIDELIEKASQNWNKDRISKVSISILRLAIYEILFVEDIPPKVSANEAVELAKKFDDEKSYAFINGILGYVIKNNPNSNKAEPDKT